MRELTLRDGVDEVVQDIAGNMLAGVIECKYDSFMGDISRYVVPGQSLKLEAILKKYWPLEREFAQQLAEIKEVNKDGFVEYTT